MSLYLPTPHAVQVPPFGPVYPAVQVQAPTAVLAMGEVPPTGHATQVPEVVAACVDEYLAAAQSVQDTLPLTVLYFPAEQAVHGPPSGPVYPKLQSQAVNVSLDSDELEYIGHARQVAAVVAAVVVEYVPAAQLVHEPVPVFAVLYFPGLQALQLPAGP